MLWFWEDQLQEDIGARWLAKGWELGVPAIISFRRAITREYIRHSLFSE